MAWQPPALVAASYLLGSIPFGLLLTRAIVGKDPREHGSGNIGATNAMRTGGRLVGLLTLLADILKGAAPVLLTKALGMGEEVIAAVACAAFIGHIFPVWLKFNGGKGVATMFGVVLPWMPMVAVIAFAVWLLIFLATRYVALASVVAGLTLPLSAWLLTGSSVALASATLFALLMILRHSSNLQRLMAGTEPKIGRSKEQPTEN